MGDKETKNSRTRCERGDRETKNSRTQCTTQIIYKYVDNCHKRGETETKNSRTQCTAQIIYKYADNCQEIVEIERHKIAGRSAPRKLYANMLITATREERQRDIK